MIIFSNNIGYLNILKEAISPEKRMEKANYFLEMWRNYYNDPDFGDSMVNSKFIRTYEDENGQKILKPITNFINGQKMNWKDFVSKGLSGENFTIDEVLNYGTVHDERERENINTEELQKQMGKRKKYSLEEIIEKYREVRSSFGDIAGKSQWIQKNYPYIVNFVGNRADLGWYEFKKMAGYDDVHMKQRYKGQAGKIIERYQGLHQAYGPQAENIDFIKEIDPNFINLLNKNQITFEEIKEMAGYGDVGLGSYDEETMDKYKQSLIQTVLQQCKNAPDEDLEQMELDLQLYDIFELEYMVNEDICSEK